MSCCDQLYKDLPCLYQAVPDVATASFLAAPFVGAVAGWNCSAGKNIFERSLIAGASSIAAAAATLATITLVYDAYPSTDQLASTTNRKKKNQKTVRFA